MIDHGSSVSVFRSDGSQDADFDGPEVTGVRAVLENVVCILQTPLGAIFFDPSTGVTVPLQALINSTLDNEALRRLEAEYTQAAEEHADGVVKAVLRLVRDTNKGILLLGTIYTDEGPGQLQVSATDVLTVLFPGNGSLIGAST